ncbi:MAG: DUF5916 domain-containing protein [Vicinamibacterales bacterium]
MVRPALVACALVLVQLAASVSAQSPVSAITRGDDGATTVRAVRVDAPLSIDGVLAEPLYETVSPMTGFIQVEPDPGALASERTETWLAFDADNVYVAFRVWDTQMDRLVATEMRRDNGNIWSGNDIVVFVFDTFNDRRSSISFTVNALGGRSDGQVINERQFNPDWNPVWTLKTGRFDGGWTLEAALPFKSLRYAPGTEQVWGFNAMRVKRSKNEISTLTAVPPSQGQQGVEQPVYAATLLGIQAPARGAAIDLKPYATSSLTSDEVARPRVHNDGAAAIGFDAKYAVTRNLAADFTLNTDFAQVEADQQQVNLTRFSLFFPEKRDFFLENQGTFSFGGVAVGSLNAGASDAPILFYSRRIGLDGGLPVPIEAGGRLTGRAGRYSIGAVNIQAGAAPAGGTPSTNFTVARLKRDLFRRSSVGLMFTNRSAGTGLEGANRVFGLDGTFAFFQNLQVNTYWARSDSDGAAPEDARTSHRAQMEYLGDRYGLQLERLAIGRAFAPGVGFVRRADMVRSFASARFSPRASTRSRIRKLVYQASVDHIENGRGQLETRTRTGEFAIDFRNADRLGVVWSNAYEFLPAPFRIGPGVTLPSGSYAFDTVRLNYNLGQQRAVSANLSAEHGTFYSGHKTTVSVARGRVPVTHQLSLEPTWSWNRVRLREGRFSTHLMGTRVTYTMTPLMFVSALLQYNSGTNAVSTNARLRWEYQPGSELFVVYNEERNTLTPSFPELSNRSLIVKVNRLFRF